jgi:hypothetical protein
MKRNNVVKWIVPSAAISPCGLCVRACVLLGFFLFCQLMGWRGSTMVLSGTRPVGLHADQAFMQGVLYVIAYLGVTVVAPVLILAAGVLAWLNRCVDNHPTKNIQPEKGHDEND